MFKALIEIMLGEVGRSLITLYNQYHVAINIIVVIYGTLLIWAHINLRQVAWRMEAVMIDLARKSEPPLDVQRLFDAFSNQWKASPERKRTFLPSRNDLWFFMADSSDLVEILNLKKEYMHVVLRKARLLDPAETLPKQTYRAWELYRHQLLTGVRAHHLEPDVQLKMRKKGKSA